MSNTPKFDRDAFIAIASLVGNMIGVDIAKSAESIADKLESDRMEKDDPSSESFLFWQIFNESLLHLCNFDAIKVVEAFNHSDTAMLEAIKIAVDAMMTSPPRGNGKHAAEERFDDVEAALDTLGVDKPAQNCPSFNECTSGCGTECSLASAPEPEGVLWEVALRDNIGGTIEFRADTIEYGVEDDCGIIAFVNDKLSFYAPPGAYLFARKVIG